MDVSTQVFDTGGDGLLNRIAWVGDGDAVLFIDDDGDGMISETKEFVFTEWDPTAEDDLAALRAVFDSNDDGVLDASDARFGDFKLLVTNPDGSTTARTLAELGITSIRLTADTTLIALPDGSVGGYFIREGERIVPVTTFNIDPERATGMLGGKVALRLAKGIETWARAQKATHVLYHVTAGIEAPRADRFFRRIGMKLLGGNYGVQLA